jgi:hypothetical protein
VRLARPEAGIILTNDQSLSLVFVSIRAIRGHLFKPLAASYSHLWLCGRERPFFLATNYTNEHEPERSGARRSQWFSVVD